MSERCLFSGMPFCIASGRDCPDWDDYTIYDDDEEDDDDDF